MKKWCLFSVAAIMLLAQLVSVRSGQAQTRESLEYSVATFDALLTKTKPGQTEMLIGDMQWSVEDIRTWNQSLKDKLAGRKSAKATFHVASNQQPWTNGTVPYIIESAVSSAVRTKLNTAFFTWQKAANIRFVKQTTETNFAQIHQNPAGGGSNSPLGMGSGKHTVNIQADAPQHLHVTHELGHLLGYAHEQTRPDRDNFITLNTSCFDPSVDPANNINFALLPTQAQNANNYGQTVGTYDFFSIMHYPDRDGNTDNDADPTCVQLVAKDSTKQSIISINGTYFNRIETQGPSALDMAGMAARYGNPLSISGRVIDGTGSGIQDAVITCTGTDSNFPYYGPTVKTLSNGTYILPGTSTGSYTVTCSKSGYSFKTNARSVTTTNASVPNIDFVAGATITLSTNALAFSVSYDGNTAPSQTFTVKNTGDSSTTLNYTVSENLPWLTRTPGSGTSTGEEDTITVSVNATGLTRGLYSGTITVSDPNASNNPQTINVTLYRGGEYVWTGNADDVDQSCVPPGEIGVPGDPTSWSDGRNWGLYCFADGPPGPFDKAVIGLDAHGQFVQVNPQGAIVGGLELKDDAALIGRVSLTINNEFNWTESGNGGFIEPNITISSGGVFNIAGNAPRTFAGSTLTNRGTVNWMGGQLVMTARLNAAGDDYEPTQVINLGTFRITVTGGTSAGANMYVTGNGTATRVFDNAGILEADAGAGETIYFSGLKFNNHNVVDVKSGGLTIYPGGPSGQHEGTFQTAAGTTFTLTETGNGVPGLQTFSDTVRFIGAGQSILEHTKVAGKLTAGFSPSGAGRLLLTGNQDAPLGLSLTTVGSGLIEVGTPVFGGGGTGLQGGTWTITPNSVVNFIDATNNLMEFNAVKLDNQGTLNVRKTGFKFSGANTTFTNSSTLNLEMDDGQSISSTTATPPTLTNTGTISKTIGGTTNDLGANIKIVNTGAINGLLGTLRLSGATATSLGGTLNASSGAVIDITDQGGASEQELNNTQIIGNGRVRIAGGNGLVKLIGTITAGRPADGGAFEFASGYLSGGATSKITGPNFVWTGGQVTGLGVVTNTDTPGFLNIDANGVMTIELEDAPSTFPAKYIFGSTTTGSATINNAGTVNWRGGRIAGTDGTNSGFSASAFFKNTGTFNAINTDPDPLKLNTIYGLGTTTGTTAVNGFINTGIINKSGSGICFIDSRFSSTTQINVTGGILQLADGSASGIFNVGSGTFIDIVGSGSQFGRFRLNDLTFSGLGRTRVTSGRVQQEGNLQAGTVTGNGTLEIAGTFYGSSGTTKLVRGPNLIFNGGTLGDRPSADFGTNTAGTLNLASDGILTILSGGMFGDGVLKNSGLVNWNAGVLDLSDTGFGFDNLAGATFNANGTNFKGNLRNAGMMNLGATTTPYILDIGGTFEQTSTGKLNVKIGGANADTPQFDQIRVNGSIKVAGTLGVKTINNYVPPADTEFVVLSGGARTDTFATIEDQTADNRGFTALYHANDVTLKVLDESPQITINDVNVLEGNSVNFTVTLSKTSLQAVTVKYATANGSATAPGDYTTKTGTLTIPAGQTKGTINVVTAGDILDELDETFFVNLSAPIGATIADLQGRGIIIDNDAAPSVSINDVTVTEGNADINATFTITLSAPSGQTITVNAIPSNGSARSPFDYTSGGKRLVFNPGETVKTFDVPVKGDLLDEPQENFFVILSQPINTSISRGRGVCTINDNDAAPSITVDDVRIGEGNSGQRVASFRLKLSAPSGQVVKVNYATGGGSATAGNDYDAVTSTQIAFTTGNLYAYARVLINGDVLNEPDETFNVNLTAPINATIADNQALGTILNDDSAPALTIDDVSISEGNSGTKNLVFTVTLSKASGQVVNVNYATADGTARSTSDYTAKSGTLTFAVGSALTRTISVPITGDTTAEGDETFFVLLSGATNSSISKARGVGTITNDDGSG